jgi:hypothetical protein
MAALIFSLCALTALGCCVLLLRAYARTRVKLLLWSGLCFAGLTVSNLVVVIDELALPMQDLSPWRVSIGVASVAILLFGLIIFGERR